MTLIATVDQAQQHANERAQQDVTRSVGRTVLEGAVGGVIGAGAMSALMLAAHKMGLLGRLPPERITQRIFFRGFRRTQRREKAALASALHVGFGATAGSLFGPVSNRILGGQTPIVYAGLGILYGSFIWFVSYMGWAPALGLMPQAHRDRPDRPIIMVIAHWVFGATLGAFVGMRGQREH